MVAGQHGIGGAAGEVNVLLESQCGHLIEFRPSGLDDALPATANDAPALLRSVSDE